MFQNSMRPTTVSERRIPIVLIVTVAVAVFALTWIAIRKSRSDSYQLLVLQGIAFTEALAQASAPQQQVVLAHSAHSHPHKLSILG